MYILVRALHRALDAAPLNTFPAYDMVMHK